MLLRIKIMSTKDVNTGLLLVFMNILPRAELTELVAASRVGVRWVSSIPKITIPPPMLGALHH